MTSTLTTAAAGALLDVQALGIDYGQHTAVHELAFQVRAGECVALIGRNGAGKTSTLNAVTGQLVPSRGRVLLGGAILTRDALDVRRRLGFIPDHPEVPEYLTAREYVRFLGALYGLDVRAADAAALPLFARLDLTAHRDQLLKGFSYGMRQKVVITATLAHDPDLLILDEPIVGLDPIAARTLQQLLRERVRAGRAVLFSTHLLSVAAQVADRIVIVHEGACRAAGTLSELQALAGARADEPLEDVFFRLIGETGLLATAEPAA